MKSGGQSTENINIHIEICKTLSGHNNNNQKKNSIRSKPEYTEREKQIEMWILYGTEKVANGNTKDIYIRFHRILVY